MTLRDRLAAFFRERPCSWIDGRQLAAVAGGYAWRTRVSELRRRPFNLAIENRQRRVQSAAGETCVVSEYRLVDESCGAADIGPANQRPRDWTLTP